jgi:hypothetical protein
MAGLLDGWDGFLGQGMDDPRTQGILAIAASLMNMRKGDGYGNALMAGVNAYGGAQRAQGERQERDILMQQRKREMARQDAADRRAGLVDDAYRRAAQPSTDAGAFLGNVMGGDYTTPSSQVPDSAQWMQRAQQNLQAAGMYPEAMALAKQAQELNKPLIVGGDSRLATPDGKVLLNALPKLQALNLGGREEIVDMQDPNNAGRSLPRTMTPGEVDSSRRGWAGLQLQQDQQNLPVFDAGTGSFVYRPNAQNPSGAAVPVPGMPAKPYTEQQGKAAAFADTMLQAERIMRSAEANKSQNFGTTTPQTPEVIPGALRSLGMDAAANQVESDSRAKVRQAQESWVRAKLRLESGAVIGKDEMDQEIRTYFPQRGESQATQEQKALMREIALRGVAGQAGNRYQPVEDPSAPKLENVTANDIRNTALKYGLTVDEVKRRLGIQ